MNKTVHRFPQSSEEYLNDIPKILVKEELSISVGIRCGVAGAVPVCRCSGRLDG